MRIKFVGTGAALNSSNVGSCILIDDNILIDVPPACPELLLNYNVDLGEISNVFITHLHGDHYFGFPFLLLQYSVIPRKNKLCVHAPEKLRENTIDLIRLAFPEAQPEEAIERCTIFEMLKDYEAQVDDYLFSTVEAEHTIETYGLLINNDNLSLYITSDTAFNKHVEQTILKADIIIADTSTRGFSLPGHMSIDKIIKLAKKYPNKVFFATHRTNYRFEDIIIKNLIFPHDKDEYNV